MQNLNNIINRLNRAGLISRTDRGSSDRSLSQTVTDNVMDTVNGKVWQKPSRNSLQAGALAVVGGIAWKAYQVYSQQGYGRITSLQKVNLQ